MRNGYELRKKGDPKVLDRLLAAHEVASETAWLGPTSHAIIVILLPSSAFLWDWRFAVFATVVWSAFCVYVMQQNRKYHRDEVKRILYLPEPEYEDDSSGEPSRRL